LVLFWVYKFNFHLFFFFFLNGSLTTFDFPLSQFSNSNCFNIFFFKVTFLILFSLIYGPHCHMTLLRVLENANLDPTDSKSEA
jgi:hypothetical protein